MNPAATPVLSRDRLERFRGLRARLDPSGAPEDALAELYVEAPGSVSARLAAELSLAPGSTHLLIGGVGSGKTTQLLATQRLVSQIHDVRALYLDVSKRHDIAKMAPGVVAVQIGLALADALEGTAGVQPLAKRLHEIANGYWVFWEPDPYGKGDPGEDVPGILVSPDQIVESVRSSLEPLEGLLKILRDTTEHLVVMLDGLDRMTDVPAFEQSVIHDVKALASIGVGVVLVGPLRALYGLDRTITERFDSFHYQPWIDVKQVTGGRTFFVDVLRRRVPADAVSDPAIDEIVLASGGVLRDLLTLAQSACVEAYLDGSDRVEIAEVATAVDTFGRKHLQGLRPPEVEALQRVRTKGTFVHTSEDDLALLMTRRVLEYRHQGQLRYAVHPTIEKLLEELAALDPSVQIATLRPRGGSQLIVELAATAAELVIVDARSFAAPDWALLDRRRSSLAHPGVLIFVTTPSSFDELMRSAPNLASWLGAEVFAYVQDGADADATRARRLDALRAWASRSDADVIRAAEAGTLPRDPEYGEWLVLLGRGDLLGSYES